MPSSISRNGHKLTYTLTGRPGAAPLLMVHGWLSYRGVWQQTIEALGDHYYCLALDLLGFGESDKPADADYSIQAQGQRVLELADCLGWDRFTLVGHSMGGQIALCIASTLAPERVTQLVNVAGVVSGRLTPTIERVNYRFIALGAVFPGIYTLWRRLSRYDWFTYSTFKTWFYRMESLPLDRWAQDRYMAFQPGIQIPAYKAGQAIHNLDLTPYLERIKAPVLTIFGRQDGVVPVSDGYLVEQHVPHSELALIDECGHFPMYEKPREYLQALHTLL